MNKFLELLGSGRILVADGATGTNLQQRGLERGAPSERWVLERPEEIVRLHRDFIAAGADLILTCTFGGTAMRLEHAGMAGQAAELNRQAVALARQAAAGTDVLVAGSIGPTGQLLKPLGPLEEADAISDFATQAKTLAEAGADLLVVETQFDLAEARAAIQAVRAACRLPLVCSFSYDRGTRTMMGVRPAQMAQELGGLVDVLGINCGRSLDDNLKALQELRAATSLPIWFKPNAGLPALDEHGSPTYTLTPEQEGRLAPAWVQAGARVVGGCCGTSPEHLAAIAAAVKAQ
jgi:5-methyltetrahydrofolate--homocysteine methyltransferase